MAKLGHGIVRQGITEPVANLTTLPTDSKTEARNSESSMAGGVANLNTLPTGWQNRGRA